MLSPEDHERLGSLIGSPKNKRRNGDPVNQDA